MSVKNRLLLDVALFAALLVANNPVWTGLAIHEWLGVAVVVPLLVHLIINWDWAVRIATSFVDRLYHTSRLNLIVDATLFVATVAVILSGFMVSKVVLVAFGLAATPTALWIAVHSASADATIFVLMVHLVMHAKWVTRAIRSVFAISPAPSRTRTRVGARTPVRTHARARFTPVEES